ncbi:MAG: hypothetical protein ACFN27_02590 [Prevotella sp.]
MKKNDKTKTESTRIANRQQPAESHQIAPCLQTATAYKSTRYQQ